MALITEVLLVSGVALDLVGAGVLSHAHNAESIVELREDIGEEGAAVGEPDALSTHAQLLAEKRIGFLLLTVGLVLYLSGVVLKSPEGQAMMGTVAGGVVVAGLVPGARPALRAAAAHGRGSGPEPGTAAEGHPRRGGGCGRATRAVADHRWLTAVSYSYTSIRPCLIPSVTASVRLDTSSLW